MRYQDDKSKNLIFDNYFSNLNFLKTIAHKRFRFYLLTLGTHLEGTVSQIFYLCLSFNFMPKTGKHFVKFVTIIFKTTLNNNQGLNKKSETQFPPSLCQECIHQI